MSSIRRYPPGSGCVRRVDDEVDVGPGPALLDLVEHELEDEVGELARQPLDERRHPGRAGGGEVADREPPRPAVAQVGDELVEPAPLAHHLVGLGVEHERRLGRRDAPPDPVEQGQAGLPLEGREVLADRRRGEAEVVGGGLDGAAGDDGAEDAEAVEVEHGPIISADLTTPK